MPPKKKTRKDSLAAPIQTDECWAKEASYFPQRGEPNAISYTRRADTGCLLAYDAGGELAGMLFYYFADIPMPPGWHDSADPERTLVEKAGNINLLVRSDKRRQGLGTKLLQEAVRRWEVDLDKQTLTPQGSLLVKALRSG